MATDKKDIELRSEKVRNIVGKVPSLLLRKGITIISFVILFFIAGAYFMPYPETAGIKVKIYTIPPVELIRSPHYGIICLSEMQENRVSRGQKLGCLLVKDSLTDLIAPFWGTLVVNAVNGNVAEKGEVLFAVIPDTMTTFYCSGSVPGEIINKIKAGQQVDVRYTATGTVNDIFIRGKVSRLYPLPADTLYDSYKVDVQFDTLPAHCAFEIPFREVDATIHLSDKSVLGRFLESIGLN